MEVYILNLISIPLYGMIIKNKKYLTILLSVQMFLILAFRGNEVGMDLTNYIGGYECIKKLSFGELCSKLHLLKVADLGYPYSYESGYAILNWIFGRIGFSFHGFLVIVALFTMVTIGSFIYRFSKNIWLSFVLFVGCGMYLYSFGILRQTIALCVLLWSVPCIKDRKMLRFLLFIVIAFLIHRSSIIFIVLYFMYNFRISKKTLSMYIVFCLVFLFVCRSFLQSYISNIIVFFGKSYGTDFSMNNQILLMFCIAIFTLLFLSENNLKKSDTRLVLYGFLLSIPVEIVGMSNDVLARAIEYYYIFVIILIPLVLDNYRVCMISEKNDNWINGITTIVIRLAGYVFILIAMLFLMTKSIINTPLYPYRVY